MWPQIWILFWDSSLFSFLWLVSHQIYIFSQTGNHPLFLGPPMLLSTQVQLSVSKSHVFCQVIMKEKINIFSFLFLFFFERKNESRSWDFGTLEQARAHGCNNDRVGNPVSSVWHVKNWVPFTLCFIISYVMSEVMPLPSSVFLF